VVRSSPSTKIDHWLICCSEKSPGCRGFLLPKLDFAEEFDGKQVAELPYPRAKAHRQVPVCHPRDVAARAQATGAVGIGPLSPRLLCSI
jgi:hypothetical protein